MNEQKLIEYIKDRNLTMTLDGLAVRTGETVPYLRTFVKEHNLEGYLIGRFDAVIHDLLDKDPNTYTIKQLAMKYDVPYMSLYKYLSAVGFKHLCVRPKRRNAGDIQRILEMSTHMTVVEISRYNKENDLTPQSREGIMNVYRDYGVTPITKKSRRLKKELNGGSL